MQRNPFSKHLLDAHPTAYLGLIFVFDVNIYSSSLRLFKIAPVVSVLAATQSTIFHFTVVFALHWLHITFVLNTLITSKELFFRPVT